MRARDNYPSGWNHIAPCSFDRNSCHVCIGTILRSPLHTRHHMGGSLMDPRIQRQGHQSSPGSLQAAYKCSKTYPILLFFFICWTSTLKRLVIPYKQFLVPGSSYYTSMTLLPVSWDFGFFGALTVILCSEKWKEVGRLHHIDCGVVNMDSSSSSCRLWFGLILWSQTLCVVIYKKIWLTCNEIWLWLSSGQLLSSRECPPGRCAHLGHQTESRLIHKTDNTPCCAHRIVTLPVPILPSIESHKTCWAYGQTVVAAPGSAQRFRRSAFEGAEDCRRPSLQKPMSMYQRYATCCPAISVPVVTTWPDRGPVCGVYFVKLRWVCGWGIERRIIVVTIPY